MKIPFAKFVHLKLFERVIEIVFGIMLLFITLGIIIGTIHLFLRLPDLLAWEDSPRHYVAIISDVLTLFILVELSRTLADYFTAHRLRMTFIVDAGIVFILRELVVKLFEAKIDIAEMYALSALIAVLGARGAMKNDSHPIQIRSKDENAGARCRERRMISSWCLRRRFSARIALAPPGRSSCAIVVGR